MHIAGEKAKLELIKFVGWGISGLIAIFGVIGLLQRAAALDKQNETTEKGHVQERFKAATEHLGNRQASVRIAAFYEFYRLAKIKSEPDLREHIFYILCAHLRQTTKHKNYKPEKSVLKNGDKEIKPTEEVQNLLNILFKPRKKDEFLFGGLEANLEETNLQGANLRNAKLQKINLRKTNLQNAHLSGADLQEAKMWLTDLQCAFMEETNLQKTQMIGADLRGAHLRVDYEGLSPEESENANLQEALLTRTKINQDTIMPNNDWKKVIGRFHGNIGIEVVDDKENVIARID